MFKENKGSVAVRFDWNGTSFCFVNSHFSPHTEELQKRNEDYRRISDGLTFTVQNVPRKIASHE